MHLFYNECVGSHTSVLHILLRVTRPICHSIHNNTEVLVAARLICKCTIQHHICAENKHDHYVLL